MLEQHSQASKQSQGIALLSAKNTQETALLFLQEWELKQATPPQREEVLTFNILVQPLKQGKLISQFSLPLFERSEIY